MSMRAALVASLALFALPLASGQEVRGPLASLVGSYRGSSTLVSAGTTTFGRTDGFFTTNASGRNGALTLSTQIEISGVETRLTEVVFLKGPRISYTLAAGTGGGVTALGTAATSRNRLRFTATSASEGTTYVISGFARKVGRRLLLDTTILAAGSTTAVSHRLRAVR